jgi:hypothetical protein
MEKAIGFWGGGECDRFLGVECDRLWVKLRAIASLGISAIAFLESEKWPLMK